MQFAFLGVFHALLDLILNEIIFPWSIKIIRTIYLVLLNKVLRYSYYDKKILFFLKNNYFLIVNIL